MALTPLLTILPLEAITKLATRSNFRLGGNILKNGKIEFRTKNTFHITASVQHKNQAAETVDFLSDHKGFHFKCSCSNRKNNFCEHCTAAALALNL